jgi:hypothetical protein
MVMRRRVPALDSGRAELPLTQTRRGSRNWLAAERVERGEERQRQRTQRGRAPHAPRTAARRATRARARPVAATSTAVGPSAAFNVTIGSTQPSAAPASRCVQPADVRRKA